MTDLISRRQMLSAALAATGALTVAALGASGAETKPSSAPPKVDEKDSLATALGYVSDARRVDPKANPTYKTGASCSSCSWYQGKPGDPAGGACTFFPGKNVDANGWCRMWNKKQ
jgi:anaerobic selenocysteine-containing dehydrogenase